MQTKMPVNGELVAGDGETLPVVNPATGEEIVGVPETSEVQLRAAMYVAAH